MIRTLMHIAKEEKMRGLFRGIAPTLMRDGPFSGVYYLAYSRLKAACTLHPILSSVPTQVCVSVCLVVCLRERLPHAVHVKLTRVYVSRVCVRHVTTKHMVCIYITAYIMSCRLVHRMHKQCRHTSVHV